jgi:hypothetical protein
MRTLNFWAEADLCRFLAEKHADRPEAQLASRLAHAFQQLAEGEVAVGSTDGCSGAAHP